MALLSQMTLLTKMALLSQNFTCFTSGTSTSSTNDGQRSGVTAQDATRVRDAAGRAIEEAQKSRREEDAVDHAALVVVRALVPAIGQGRRGLHHVAAFRDVAAVVRFEWATLHSSSQSM